MAEVSTGIPGEVSPGVSLDRRGAPRFVMPAEMYRVIAAIERMHGTAPSADEVRVQATAATITPTSRATERWVRKIAASLYGELAAHVILELDATAPQCAHCGCSDFLACEGGCSWVEPSDVPVCSECNHKRNACPHCGSHPNDACDRDCPVYLEACDGHHAPGACPLLDDAPAAATTGGAR